MVAAWRRGGVCAIFIVTLRLLLKLMFPQAVVTCQHSTCSSLVYVFMLTTLPSCPVRLQVGMYAKSRILAAVARQHI
jgi:hypothetical protein